MSNKRLTIFFDQENITKRLCSILLSLFIFLPAIAQNGLEPFKVTLYKDAGQVGSKGIIRFDKQKAEIPMRMDIEPASVNLTAGAEYRITWFRLRSDSLPVKYSPRTIPEVLQANLNRTMTVVCEIGGEYDEITGNLRMVDEKGNLLLIRTSDNSEYYLPLNRVAEVIIEGRGNQKGTKKELRKILEIGLNKDVPFIPLEMFSAHAGLSWSPVCRLRILGSDRALLQMHAHIINETTDLKDVELELSSASYHGEGLLESETMNAGKLSLRKGDRLMMNIHEAELEYENLHLCRIPWAGTMVGMRPQNFPVENSLLCAIPPFAGFSCNTYSVINEDNRNIANVEAERKGADGKVELHMGQEEQVSVKIIETVASREKKAIKQGEKLMQEVIIEGKIQCANSGETFIRLDLEREVAGEIANSGKGQIANSPKGGGQKILKWRVPLDVGQSKDVVYQYKAILPYEKP